MTASRLGPFVALLTALAMPPTDAAASCAAPATPCRAYATTPVIFQGFVERTTRIDDYEDRLYGSGPAQLVHMRVERSWKGLTDVTTVDVVTLVGRSSNEFEFAVNQRYVIWARPAEAGTWLRTSICSRTRLLKNAAEDIEFLESLALPAPGGFVYGKVWFKERYLSNTLEAEGLENAVVVLAGKQFRRETRTDANGQYRFNGLPAGSYDVSVVLEAQTAAARVDYGDARQPVQELPVRSTVVIEGPRDCAEAAFWVQSNGSISGVARIESGRPVSGIVVQAALVDEVLRIDAEPDRRKVYLNSGQAVTGADGAFEFTNMPPGRYVVGVSLEHNVTADHPYPRTFYPGVARISEAAVVELLRGEHLQIGGFTLPAPLSQTIVQGCVIGLDGKPAAGAWVGATNHLGAPSGNATTAADGCFSLTLYDNQSYRLRAMIRGTQGIIAGEATLQVDVPGGAGEPLKIVLKPPVVK